MPSHASEQKAAGKDRRRHAPRPAHAELGVNRDHRDILALIEDSNHDRLEQLVPVRHSRMVESPFAFFRGTAAIQAFDLARTANSGIIVQACGDCHLMNFGDFATPERNLAFDINDFDETFPAPWEWDVKRLAASLVLAARWRRFSASAATAIVAEMVRRYRERMREYSGMSTLDVWYSRITAADILAQYGKNRTVKRIVEADMRRAGHSTAEYVFQKLTIPTQGGDPRIVDQPPLIFHPSGADLHGTARAFLEKYAATLRADYQILFDRFRYVDVAIKVVGVGSVGTRCFIALMLGHQNDPFFLQIKEARRSVLQQHLGKSPWKHEGERVVTGQRLMQAVSDIFLGWARGPRGRDFYVRQLRDMKVSVNLSAFDADILAQYGGLCGSALARAHAKAGHAAEIAGYLGSGDAFDAAICKYAAGYADQVERDYEVFQNAVRSGRIKTETSATPLEVMIS